MKILFLVPLVRLEFYFVKNLKKALIFGDVADGVMIIVLAKLCLVMKKASQILPTLRKIKILQMIFVLCAKKII